MQYHINGGIYRVVFSGSTNSEFSGEHPGLIIRTLKEDDIYLVLPLTTYSKEKMEKVKRNGFGYHIKSTNSIARIDKMQITHVRDIKNRWLEKGIVKLHPDELKELTDKTIKYIQLSSDKTRKEYSKYYEQYNYLLGNFDKIINSQNIEDNIFIVSKTCDDFIVQCKKKEVNCLSLIDIQQIVIACCVGYRAIINFDDDFLRIKLLKTS